MKEETLAQVHCLLDEGKEVEVDAEMAAALGFAGEIEGDGIVTAISEEEADRAIRGFAEKVQLPFARENLLALLDGPYERKLEFLMADEWVVVAPLPVGTKPKPKPPKCVRTCERVCNDICKEVCRMVCKKIGGQVICERLCHQVCQPACKRVCQIICN